MRRAKNINLFRANMNIMYHIQAADLEGIWSRHIITSIKGQMYVVSVSSFRAAVCGSATSKQDTRGRLSHFPHKHGDRAADKWIGVSL